MDKNEFIVVITKDFGFKYNKIDKCYERQGMSIFIIGESGIEIVNHIGLDDWDEMPDTFEGMIKYLKGLDTEYKKR